MSSCNFTDFVLCGISSPVFSGMNGILADVCHVDSQQHNVYLNVAHVGSNPVRVTSK